MFYSFCTGPDHGYYKGFDCQHCKREEAEEAASIKAGEESGTGVFTCRHGKSIPIEGERGEHCNDCFDMEWV